MNLNENDLHDLIEDVQNNTIEPMIYKLSIDIIIPTYEHTLPIHRKINDIVNMEVYELHSKIE